MVSRTLALAAMICVLAALTEAYPRQAPTVTLLGTIDPRPPIGGNYSGIWGYAAGGKEYALLCGDQGLSIVDVTDPAAPVEIQFLSMGGGSIHRDVAVWGNHAYVGGQEGADVHVVDLSGLPASAPIVNTLAGYTDAAHTLNVADGRLYLNTAGGMVFILDLTDPVNPVQISSYTGNDCHDTYARGTKLYTAGGFTTNYHIVDIANPAAPAFQGATPAMGSYAHQCWLSDDGTILYGTEESNNQDILIYDVSNPAAPTLITTFAVPGPTLVHNLAVKGNYLHVAYYEAGYVLVDVTDPANPVKVGEYLTWPGPAVGAYQGAWNVYTGLPSGNILVSDMATGLYILDVDTRPGPGPGPAPGGGAGDSGDNGCGLCGILGFEAAMFLAIVAGFRGLRRRAAVGSGLDQREASDRAAGEALERLGHGRNRADHQK